MADLSFWSWPGRYQPPLVIPRQPQSQSLGTIFLGIFVSRVFNGEEKLLQGGSPGQPPGLSLRAKSLSSGVYCEIDNTKSSLQSFGGVKLSLMKVAGCIIEIDREKKPDTLAGLNLFMLSG
jgi:hypothetical protein